MSIGVDSKTELLECIGAFGDAVDGLCGNWARLPDNQRMEAYTALERARKRLALVDAKFFQAHREVVCGKNRKVRYLAERLKLGRATVRQRLNAFERLDDERYDASGRFRDTLMPKVRDKVAQGVIGADAVEKIDRAINSMPLAVREHLTEVADPHIAELVEKINVDDLDALPSMLRALFGIDDPYTPEDRQRRRGIRVGKQGPDGMSKLTGDLTPQLAAVFRRLAADYGAPGDLLPDGADDDRTHEQRLHDAVEAALYAGFGRGPAGRAAPVADVVLPDGAADAGDAASPADSLADDGSSGAVDGTGDSGASGESRAANPLLRPGRRLAPARGTTSIVAVTTVAELLAMNGVAVTDTGTRMSVTEAVERCDARNVYLQVLDFRGRTLYFGRSRRLGSMDQYLALLGEEGMSSAPGASAHGAHCDIHHVNGWSQGGRTDLSDLTFADPVMHGKVDDTRTNPDAWWTEPGEGSDEPRVKWIPPVSVDPERKPRENMHPDGWDNPGRTMRRFASDGFEKYGFQDRARRNAFRKDRRSAQFDTFLKGGRTRGGEDPWGEAEAQRGDAEDPWGESGGDRLCGG